MGGRHVGAVLLTSGLVAITLLGGAGGYGLGHLTTPDAQPSGSAVPIGPDRTPTPTPVVPVVPAKTPVPDPTEALRPGDLRYKTRAFTAEAAVRSRVTVSVPRNWWMTQPDPMKEARFTDPMAKRWIRIEAGFTLQRPPAESLAARVGHLASVPADQALRIVSQEVAQDERSATLVYTYIPERTLRYVVIRWLALDSSGNCAVEISSTGLEQDEKAVWAVLDHASESVTRSDTPL